MTVEELKEQLEMLDPDMEIRFASQPSWPFEYSINDIMPVGDVAYLEEGEQIGYLPVEAKEALSW